MFDADDRELIAYTLRVTGTALLLFGALCCVVLAAASWQ